MHTPTIREVAQHLEAWAPPGAAQSYDNVGLQVGDAARTVACGLIALDLTPAVIEEAQAIGATLVVTHHPVIFRPLRRVTTDGLEASMIFRMAEAGIALYSIHTNLDAAHGGVSFALAAQLGLEEVHFLDHAAESLYKLVTFVPATHQEEVHQALAGAGAGQIGAYTACAFVSEGTGLFRPGDSANPFIGAAGGNLEAVQEVRLEMEVSRWDLHRIIGALRDSHPYEEVAYDVYPVQQSHSRFGLGAMGVLPHPEPLDVFLRRVAERLQAGSLRYVGRHDMMIHRVAVCGGSGSDFTKHALRSGADAYVTADITYHRFFEVLQAQGQPRMALVDAGHYETEAITEQLLLNRLTTAFPAVEWHQTRTRTSPIQTFVP